MALLELETTCERLNSKDLALTVTFQTDGKQAEIISIKDADDNLYMEDEFTPAFLTALREKACEEYLEEYGR